MKYQSKQNGQILLPRQNTHIHGLDGLRGIAVIGVILYHLFPNTIKGGYLGVSLFFVLSGYLMAATSVRDWKSVNFHIASFYRKRIRRIYPPLIAVIFITAGVLKLAAPNLLNGLQTEVRSILLGYNNLWQISQNASYFTRIGNASPFTHLWSLAIEMQFYLVWPLLFLLYQKMCQSRGRRYSDLCILIPALASVLWLELKFQPGNDVTAVYYGTGTRCFSLLLGAYVGLHGNHKKKKIPQKAVVRSAECFGVMMLLLIAAYLQMDGQANFTYRVGLIGTSLLFCALLKLAADRRLPMGRWLDRKPLAWLGKRSYEIYLWQYPVIFLFQYNKWDQLPGATAIMIVIILLLAVWMQRALKLLRQLPPCFEEGALVPLNFGCTTKTDSNHRDKKKYINSSRVLLSNDLIRVGR